MFDQGCLTFYPYSTHFYPCSLPQERKKKKKELKNSNNGMNISGFRLEYIDFKWRITW